MVSIENTNAYRSAQKKKRAKDNALKSSSREFLIPELSNYSTLECKVSIIMEDDGYAFRYVKNMMKKVYPFLKVEIIGAHGEGNIKYLVDTVNDCNILMVIYDRSASAKVLDDIYKELSLYSKKNRNTQVYKVTPRAFEEIILSYIDINHILNINKGQNLLSDIHNYTKGITNNYNLANYQLYPNRINDDMILEDWLEALTKGTQYKCTHNPSFISPCWLDDCNTCQNKGSSCKQIIYETRNSYTVKNKPEQIAINSLAYAIIKIIDEKLGYKFRFCNVSIHNKKELFERM